MTSGATRPSSTKPARRTRRRARGFTLIEAALATMVLGTGMVAMIVAQRAFIAQNEWSTLSSTAQRLGNEVRELTMRMPANDPVTGDDVWGSETGEDGVADFDDLDDFDGAVFSWLDGSGPISALGAPIDDMDGWTQRVAVEFVNDFDLTEVVDAGASEMVRVTVVVEFTAPGEEDAREMARVTWLAPR